MGYICFQVDQIPDLSLNKYQSLADSGVKGVLKCHENFLRQWHGICIESSTSFHLIYVFIPSEPVGKRLKLYFILQGDDENINIIKPLLKSSPLSVFYEFIESELPEIEFKAGATLTKKERVADIFNPLTNHVSQVHYVPQWDMNESARLYDLYQMMTTISESYSPKEPCAFRVDVYPVSMTQETRKQFDPILKSLRGENDINVLNTNDSVKADNYARDICREYEDWIADIETTPHFRVNIYSFAQTLFKAKVLLNTAGSEALNTGDFSTASIRQDQEGGYRLLSRMGLQAEDYCFYSKQACLKSWSTTYCLWELVPFFRLPVLFDGEVIEIPKETAPTHVEGGLYLGQDNHNYPVNFELEELCKHAFFTGMPGSGKTNTMLHLIEELQSKDIPFLVLEPAKKEYRALVAKDNSKNIFLFSPHLQSYFPLRMNPLEFPKNVRLSEHINALLEVFQGSFVLEGPTYKFLSSAIQKSYKDLGWDIEETNDENCNLKFPSLQDVYNNLRDAIEKSSYDSEYKGNVRAFLQVRLGSLMEMDAGELFNSHVSTLAPEEWLTTSAIVELEVLGEQAKNFFVLLVCHYILETLRIDPHGSVNKDDKIVPVRHVIFIEEAHNIIASSTEQAGVDSIDPKISATAYIIKMLAEVRALRESIVIADQLPTALASEVTKNTGLKIVHRLTSKDDREKIGGAISASALQLEKIASFTKGHAFIHHEKIQKAFEIKVAKWNSQNVSYDVDNDKQLFINNYEKNTIQKSIQSAFMDWREKNLKLFQSETNDLLKQHSQLVKDDMFEKEKFLINKKILETKCKSLKRQCKRLEKLWSIESKEELQIHKDFCETFDFFSSIELRLKEMDI